LLRWAGRGRRRLGVSQLVVRVRVRVNPELASCSQLVSSSLELRHPIRDLRLADTGG